jgi:inosose dehydratase
MTATFKLATGPVTWGIDFADAPTNPPWQDVLDDIGRSTVKAMEIGPLGYLPEGRDELQAALSSRGIVSCGSNLFTQYHNPDKAEAIVATAERAAQWMENGGGGAFVIIDQPDDIRAATAGRPAVAPRLQGAGWRKMLDTIERVADIARNHGMRPVVHPHAGGYIEFIDEIERLVEDSSLDLCLDSGHLAYARTSPVEALARFGDRLGHFHFKDVRRPILDRIDAEGLTFWEAIAEGVFCPMGEGVVDTAAVCAELERIGYAGYAVIEQDRVPGMGSPLEDLERSAAVIEAARGGR